MKKLTFKEVAPERILDYNAMSKIRGGADDGYGAVGGTCGIRIIMGYGMEDEIVCGISRENVNELAAAAFRSGVPYWWCCESCPTTTYCGDGSGGY